MECAPVVLVFTPYAEKMFTTSISILADISSPGRSTRTFGN
jgi:hypothetical protein